MNPSKNAHHLPRLWCYEPHIVTWWMTITNIIANIFWTLSGGYATWPSNNADELGKIVYVAGIVACIFMIISCNLSYIESINQSNIPITIPQHSTIVKKVRKRLKFIRSARVYGKTLSPIGFNKHGVDDL